MGMNKKRSGRGNLSVYLKWPLIAVLYIILVTVIVYAIDVKTGTVLLIFAVPFIAFALYLYLNKFNTLSEAIQKAVANEAKEHGINFTKIAIPHAVVSLDGKILWANDNFLGISQDILVGKNVSEIFAELNKSLFENLKKEHVNILTSCGEKKYKADVFIMNQSDTEDPDEIKVYNENESVIIIYLYDQTEFYNLKQDYDNNKQVTGYIYIDNFDEVSENMEDSKASMLIAMVDRKLTRYVSYNKGILKKLEKDKYFFVTTKKDIEDMIEDRFSILEQTKEIIGGDNIPLTLSIGIGYEGKSIESNHDLARVAMDMALGRGGDQAVVKRGQDTLFFGGKSASNTTNVRVRARVKAASFRETLDTKDKILIMGHKNGDLDSFGASIGVYAMTKHLGKEAHIVVNSLTNDAKDFKTYFDKNEHYDKKMFIGGDEAMSIADNDTLLIVVDHNTEKISDEPRLYAMELDMVVFDHHRIAADSFTDLILSYVDPSASSTCELVTEIMTYFDEKLKLRPLEAGVMLGGILIDTKSFTYQTSAKTFEVASYLRKRGADMDKVRKMIRVDLKSEKIKNEAVNNAEIYKNAFAIAILSETDEIDMNVVKADIANELISIKGIKASIVIALDGDKYNISSRSMDDINVQVLMEKLGGGGHRSQAGASIEAESYEDAVAKVKRVIDSMDGGKE